MAMELCCLTARAITVTNGHIKKIKSEIIGNILSQLDNNMLIAGRILTEEIYLYMEKCRTDKKIFKDRYKISYPLNENAAYGNFNSLVELEREKIFLGIDNIEISLDDYKKIINDNSIEKNIYAYNEDCLILRKSPRELRNHTTHEMFENFDNVFNLCNAAKKYELKNHLELSDQIYFSLINIGNIEEGSEIFDTYIHQNLAWMKIMRNGIEKLKFDDREKQKICQALLKDLIDITDNKNIPSGRDSKSPAILELLNDKK